MKQQDSPTTVAVIDMGTNTFHLALAQLDAHGRLLPIFRRREFVRLGQGGISRGVIAEEACERAIATLGQFRGVMREYGVAEARALATSAMRSAANGPDLIRRIRHETGFEVAVIGGELEAQLIYEGVCHTTSLPPQAPVLVMDIGGGSVEFIIGEGPKVRWKQSFEIGAQRLFDRFFQQDPMPPAALRDLYAYLDEQLPPLKQACRTHGVSHFAGAAGTFDTLWDLYRQGPAPLPERAVLPFGAFSRLYQQLLEYPRSQRLAMPGMLEQRVEMIVVASALVAYAFMATGLTEVQIAQGALKEGALMRLLRGQPLLGHA